MQDKLVMAVNQRAWLWRIIIGILLFIYVGLRLINLQTTLLTEDDIMTVPALTFVPWNQLPTVIYERLTLITGPIFPTVLDAVLVNLYGASLLALRLHSVVVSVLGFIFLWRILKQLFPDDLWAQMLPCVLYTFSIPSIIYTQQIQPTVYYSLGTALQLTTFIPFYRTSYNDSALWRRMVIFVGVSTVAFFLNYISVLVTVILGAIWCFRLYDAVRHKNLKLREGMWLFIGFTASHLLLFLLILNRPYQGSPARNYFIPYYLLNLIEFIQHSYDIITYHLNYVFDTALYRPLGYNILSLPFVVLVLVGMLRFIHAERLHILYAAFALLTLYMASLATIYPYGGVRHSFALAPFVYIFVGYGVVAFRHRWREMVLGGLIVYMLVCWFLWGVNVYDMRRSRLDGAVVAQMVADYNVSTVVAHFDTYETLILQASLDTILPDTVSLIQLRSRQDLGSPQLEEPFLLVAYRTAINPTWANPPDAAPVNIPYNLEDFSIEPIITDVGLLPGPILGPQSIYDPINGFFLYYVEPK
jgi:hypothetical protein